MDIRAIFLTQLPNKAQTQVDRAVLIVAFSKQFENTESIKAREICAYFEGAHLARPNPTVLSGKLTKDRRVSVRNGQIKSLHRADEEFRVLFPDLFVLTGSELEAKIDVRLLSAAPFIDAGYLDELRGMAGLYEGLHVLENSMRRLIEAVLAQDLGSDWWNESASAPMKRKHEDRLEKEKSRKWLPARSTLGPLYSIDWADLITIIRKYEDKFKPFIGEIDFMHRYADLGLLRHVIAHHGFIENAQTEAQRVIMALRDWNSQVAPAARQHLGV